MKHIERNVSNALCTFANSSMRMKDCKNTFKKKETKTKNKKQMLRQSLRRAFLLFVLANWPPTIFPYIVALL